MTAEFRLLGSVEAIVDGRPAELGHARQRSVLAVLLVDVNEVVTLDQLADRVWGRTPPRQARATLHGYLSHLRAALAGTAEAGIERQSGGYVLAVAETATVDLRSFRRLVAQARADDDIERAAALLEQAVGLWRADAFAALDTPWINALRTVLDQERLTARLDLGDLRLRLGQHAALLPDLSALAAAHPLDERLSGQLIQALHRSGRTADALDHYQRTRRRLIEELGIGPGPALRDIQAAILRQDAAPAEHPARMPAVSGAVPVPALPPTVASTPVPSSSPNPGPVPAQLPSALPVFSGRGVELAQLDDILPADVGPARANAVVISAVSGTAGVGKTTLAVHWAHQVRKAFPDGQLYVNLRGFDPGGSVVTSREAVRGFLDAFGVPPARVPNSLEAQAALYRSLLADRRVLVVLDNARDADQVRPLLPGSPGCVALITSRDRLTSLAAAEGARHVSVDLLGPAQARDLLRARLGARRMAAEPAAVDEIVARCAGLPLALAIVAARAAVQPAAPLSALAGELREAGSRLDALDGGDPTTRIRAVFSWSYQALTIDAARLFRLLSLHPGPDVGLPAAASLAGVPRPRAHALLTELAGGYLLTEHATGRYTCHDLLRAYATELTDEQDSDEIRRAATLRMLDHYLHTAYTADVVLNRKQALFAPAGAQPSVAPEKIAGQQQALAWFAREHYNMLAAVEQARAAGLDTHCWQLAATMTTFLDRQGRWFALAAAHTTALSSARRRSDTAGEADAHRGLGLAADRLDHTDDAHAHYALALDQFRALDNPAGQARVRQNLCRMLSDRGDYRSALDHARQTLAHYQAAHDRGGQANTLNHIGWYHTRLGDHGQALTHCREALALLQELGDLNGQAHTWDSLGYINHHLGRHARAVECYRQALDLFRATGDRVSEAIGLAYLGDTHHAATNTDAAHEAWTRALAMFEELGHPDADPVRAKLEGLDSFAG